MSDRNLVNFRAESGATGVSGPDRIRPATNASTSLVACPWLRAAGSG